MAKRCIGIDLAPEALRLAVVTLEKGRPVAIETAERPWRDRQEWPGLIREVLGGDPGFGDRLVTAVPAREAFVREIVFPFADSKKIAATLPLELGSRLPLPVEDCAVAALPPRPAGDGHRVTAAAVRAAAVRDILETFDGAGLPVHLLDLAPYALATGLREVTNDAVLVCVDGRETVITLALEGRVAAYRILPLLPDRPPEQLAALIDREATLLRKSHGSPDAVTLVCGSGADDDLLAALKAAGTACGRPDLAIGGQTVAPAFVPAAAWALRAAQGDRGETFNFRQGEFALRSEWARLKGRLVTMAAVLVATLLVFGVSAWLDYAATVRRAESLEQEMVRIYRSAFPGATTIVDVPRQMQAQIRQLREQEALLAGKEALSPLAILQEIAERTPPEIQVDIGEFSYSPESVRMEGTTSTFEATNQLAKSLSASPLFADAQIADAKMSVDGQTVDFRLNLQYRAKEGTQ